MAQQAPNHDDSGRAKSKSWNIALWVAIALIAGLIGAWTIWASQQPEVHSIWAPDE